MIQTKEWSLASFLLSKEAKLLGTSVNGANEVIFQFQEDPELSNFEKSYYENDDDNVNVQNFLAAQRRIKELVFKHRGERHGR